MPRLPGFDRAEVLDSALQVFLSDGYEASSINKLLDAMAINRGSLYASFGDKETLFREVVETYSNRVDDLVGGTLVDVEAPFQAIQDFFYGAFIAPTREELSKGCLLFNTVSELNQSNPPLAEEAGRHMLKVRKLIRNRLDEAQQQALISADTDLDTQADFLLASLAGFRVLCQMGAEKEALKGVIDLTLANVFSNNHKAFQ